MLVLQLPRPAKLLVTIYGPGPSCRRLATFGRRGRAGVNRLPFSGSLFGRPLAPGRYAIVVEAVRGGERVRIGRVLVVILARDGREGGNRPLAAPDCDGSATTAAFLTTGGGDFSQLASMSGSSGDDARASAGGSTGDVAGVSAGRDDDSKLLSLPDLPGLPALPSIPAQDHVPPWPYVALALLSALAAAALISLGVRRHRESAAWS